MTTAFGRGLAACQAATGRWAPRSGKLNRVSLPPIISVIGLLTITSNLSIIVNTQDEAGADCDRACPSENAKMRHSLLLHFTPRTPAVRMLYGPATWGSPSRPAAARGWYRRHSLYRVFC